MEDKKEETPINESERRKFCDNFDNKKTFLEELAPFVELLESIKKDSHKKELADIEIIEKMTIPSN